MKTSFRGAASPICGTIRAVATALTASASMDAAIVIDDFNDGAIEVTSLGAPVSDTVVASVTGGYRQLIVAAVAGGGISRGSVDPIASPPILGVLDVANTFSAAVVTLVYDGNGAGLDALGLGNFSGETRFELVMDYLQLASGSLDATVRIRDFNGNSGELTQSLGTDLGGDTPLFYDFSNYPGTIDFSRLDAVELVFDTGNDLDVDFRVESIHAVPEPGTLALLAGAVIPFWLRRRRLDAP